MITRPVEFWLLLLICGLFLVGAVRFGAGASRSVGARDSVRWSMAALRCVLGVVALVYLARFDFPDRIGPPFGDVIAAAAFALPLWLALVGLARVVMLSWPRRWALGLVNSYIEENEFSWEEEARPGADGER